MRIVLLTIMMMLASMASAGLYKWVDDDGNVHYSQKPPRDKQFKRLKPPAPAPEDAKPLYQSQKADPKKQAADNEVTKVKAEIEKVRARNCEAAKQNLKNYTVYKRFLNKKTGELTRIDDKERERQIKKAQEGIREFCN